MGPFLLAGIVLVESLNASLGHIFLQLPETASSFLALQLILTAQTIDPHRHEDLD